MCRFVLSLFGAYLKSEILILLLTLAVAYSPRSVVPWLYTSPTGELTLVSRVTLVIEGTFHAIYVVVSLPLKT